jgi:hypothetical protein
VPDWRQLSGKAVRIPRDEELDAAVYLATVHNPVTLRRLRFGQAAEGSIPAEVELSFDFRYVNPRPPGFPKSLRVTWQVTFEVRPDDDRDS